MKSFTNYQNLKRFDTIFIHLLDDGQIRQTEKEEELGGKSIIVKDNPTTILLV